MIFINEPIFCRKFILVITNIPHKKYNAKVLLFGEYTVIDGGQALSIPLRRFCGTWASSPDKSDLIPFFEYLLTMEGYDSLSVSEAIEQNWVFVSSILQGYGAGSSGALTAAAYDSFFKKIPSDVKEVHKHLARIESFFHGKSSGLDPLTSFYNCPVLIHENSPVLLSNLNLPKGFYLYDSGKTRNTKALVQEFLTMKSDNEEFKAVLTSLNKLNNQAIKALQFRPSDLNNIMQQISLLQFEQFSKMIPEDLKDVWLSGLQSDTYYMKLSGAGGGGYFLLYAKHTPELELIFAIS